MKLSYEPPTGWRFLTVEEIAEQEKGAIRIGPFGSALKKHEFSDSGVRVLGIEDVLTNKLVSAKPKYIPEFKYRELSQYEVKAGDLLITNMGTVGRTCVVPEGLETAIISSHLIKVSLDARIAWPPYISWALNSCQLVVSQIAAKCQGAIMAGFNSSLLRQLRIPLPPLKEQQRIAEVLDRAEELRAKRRVALAQLHAISEAIFLEIFSDTWKKGWPMTFISNIASTRDGSIRTGPFGSQLLHSEFVDEGVAVIGIDNVVNNEFRWGERRFISEFKYRQLSRYTVYPGDVLITIMGTCGRCAIVPDEITLAISTKHLCCISLDPEKCLPVFLHAYFLRHPIARRYLDRTAKGAIMDGLNMAIIKDMPVPLPPLHLQHEFARRVAAVENLKATHCRSLAETDALFVSLQGRAFRGDL